MTIEVKLPQWGMAMDDADIVRWLKTEGDLVAEGEAIVEVESAKVNGTVKAPVAGRLTRIVMPEGSTPKVAETIAEIEPA